MTEDLSLMHVGESFFVVLLPDLVVLPFPLDLGHLMHLHLNHIVVMAVLCTLFWMIGLFLLSVNRPTSAFY